ncbi:YqgE/AlgH family protein [Algoriphagus sp. NF]|jgi:Putative transcriptional regulator|uniref:YqgE/AlgH family protein n=2 Tax=Algoriphagus TaxID=246875 RepID=A0ABS7N1M4_9BACT|nr:MULTISPECIES: YqgE/AlgH family protein [Algoriphagus]MBY5950222.1 YqgE/AlgH family protein [Algoriphagus marincola]MDE0561323.1 YqgE/AlgH family protein [Algoriphagus sp. NF]TDK42749.1 YqgE/AlgH family protein [Algoriphagus aquimaris]
MKNQSTQNPQAGDLLISEPFLQDENFSRSVVLLCEHNEEGSFGLVLNKPSILRLNEIVDGMDFLDAEVYVGGPVEQNTLHFVYVGEKKIEGSIKIGEQLWWGGDFQELVEALRLGLIQVETIRFFLGYSGWAPDQLQEELSENVWIICQSEINPDTLANTPEELWRSLLKNMGGEFKVIANYPPDPRLN